MDIFWTEQKLKVHRFTNKLQGLQKVKVKHFPWNIIPWNALLFEKTLKQSSILGIENNGFILNTCHDTAKRAETRVGFPVIFSRIRWPNEPKFSQDWYFILSCDTRSVGIWTILFTCCAIALTKIWKALQTIFDLASFLATCIPWKLSNSQTPNWNPKLHHTRAL